MNEITSAFSLSKLARPQQSVSSRGRSDTVSELADLPKLDARAFFDETHRSFNVELFDKSLYVGTTRAATYLGITCGTPELPSKVASLETAFVDTWR
jgi:hypothetical protein